MEEKKQDCQLNGGWGINKKNPTQRTFPPIWPGVLVWLLVGVAILISKIFF